MNEHDKKAAAIFAKASRQGRVLDVRRDGASTLTVTPMATAAQKAAADAAVQAAAQPTAQEEEAAKALREDASARLLRHRDALIRMLLAERMALGEIQSADPRELDEAGQFKGFTFDDGTMEYELNGKVLVTFWTPEVAFDFGEAGFMNVFQRYRVAV